MACRFRFRVSACLTAGLMIFLVHFLLVTPQSATASSETIQDSQYIAYYFLTNKRCGPCYRMEKWTETSIQTHFQQAIESGKLTWQTVNVEKPENKHYIDDFNLYTKSVVIVEQVQGETVRWKNLEKVWQLLGSQEKFSNYVTESIQIFMEKG